MIFEYNMNNYLLLDFFKYCSYTLNNIKITSIHFNTVSILNAIKDDQNLKNLTCWHSFNYYCFCFKYDKNNLSCHMKYNNHISFEFSTISWILLFQIWKFIHCFIIIWIFILIIFIQKYFLNHIKHDIFWFYLWVNSFFIIYVRKEC
jgi:hypothetical protein